MFHAGSKFDADGDIVTNGGRVLGVTAKGKDLKEARANAYQATEWVEFGNKYMRHDIGKAIDVYKRQCLACVCKSKEVDEHSQVHNKRICKDGPVFLADDIEL